MLRALWCSIGCALAIAIIGCDSGDGSGEDGGSAGAAGAAGTNAGEGGGGQGGSGGTSAGAGGHGGSAGTSAGAGGAGGVTAGSGGTAGNEDDAGAGTGGVGHMPITSECNGEPAAEAPSAQWVNVTGSLAGMASECGNLTLVAADPCSGRVIAGVAKVGLYATSDGGASWDKLGTGAGSASIGHRPSSIIFDPEHPEVFYETGIYGALNDGVFKTEDSGATFQHLGEIGHIDLIGVDFTDPERKTLLAGVHETKRKLWLSRDGGMSWNDIGMALPEDSHFSSAPLVLDADRFLLGACGWGDGTCGVLASDNGGASWSSKSTEAPAGQPLWMKDGNMVWPTIYGSGALISANSGESWTKVDGPRSTPVELPDGRIVAVGGDHLILSSDAGETWTAIGEPLPFQAAGVAYSPARQTFFIWHNDCGESVLADAVMSAGLAD